MVPLKNFLLVKVARLLVNIDQLEVVPVYSIFRSKTKVYSPYLVVRVSLSFVELFFLSIVSFLPSPDSLSPLSVRLCKACLNEDHKVQE